jgi:hypothetical protein
VTLYHAEVRLEYRFARSDFFIHFLRAAATYEHVDYRSGFETPEDIHLTLPRIAILALSVHIGPAVGFFW